MLPATKFNPKDYLVYDLNRYGVTINLANGQGPAHLITCSQLQLIQQAYAEESIKCAKRFRLRNPNLD